MTRSGVKPERCLLRQRPLCAECRRNGALTPATVVDHIIPRRGDMELFRDQKNRQPLCKDCMIERRGAGCEHNLFRGYLAAAVVRESFRESRYRQY